MITLKFLTITVFSLSASVIVRSMPTDIEMKCLLELLAASNPADEI